MYFLLILFHRKNEFDSYHFTIYIHRKKIPQLYYDPYRELQLIIGAKS